MASNAPSKRRSILNLAEVRSRLSWADIGSGLDTSDGPAPAARLLSWLFGCGAVLLALTLLLPGDPTRDTGALIAVAIAGALASLGYLNAYDRTPKLALACGPALGSLMIGISVYYAGPAASAAYGMLLIWVVIAAAPQGSHRVTFANAAFALAVYVVAIIATPGVPQMLGLKVFMAAGTLAVTSAVIGGLASHRRELVGRLSNAARTDPLTGLLNRRALDEGFDTELARSLRNRNAVSLVMIDIDCLKRFNDERGHPAGDQILVRLANTLRDTTRGADLVARLGGDEFAVLAPETGIPGALALAERLRRAIEVEFSGDSPVLTASLGVSGSPAHGGDRMQLMKAADEALYDAKQSGRNRASVSSIDPNQPQPERRVGDLVV